MIFIFGFFLSDIKVKEKVVDLLLGLMSSHDTLYQQDRWSSRRKASTRVALMYLPLLTAVTMDSSFLNLLQLDFENENDTVKNKLLSNEKEINDFDLYTTDGYKSKILIPFMIIIKDYIIYFFT